MVTTKPREKKCFFSFRVAAAATRAKHPVATLLRQNFCRNSRFARIAAAATREKSKKLENKILVAAAATRKKRENLFRKT